MPPGSKHTEQLDALARRLAELEADPQALGKDSAATLADLKAQLDTLAYEASQPHPADPVSNESALGSALARIEDLGREPSHDSPRDAGHVLAGALAEAEADLGAIGQYRLLAELGRGGMGAVYKALHTHLEKTVALKVLPAEKLKDPLAVARFRREMKAVGKLDHPHIVRALDAGEADGQHYLVMEYVRGEDLATLIKCLGHLPVAEACEVVRQAALGLQHSFESGLVHRDIKPSNLILAEGGQIKILDLGLALLADANATQGGDLTATGQFMGSLDYMAPEQGCDSHVVDVRADIYSLGATLYKLLCGEAPFGGGKYATALRKIHALATEDPQPLGERRAGVPEQLAVLVHRMLAKQPEQRPSTPAEVAEAIAPFAAPRIWHPWRSRPAAASGPQPPPPQLRRSLCRPTQHDRLCPLPRQLPQQLYASTRNRFRVCLADGGGSWPWAAWRPRWWCW